MTSPVSAPLTQSSPSEVTESGRLRALSLWPHRLHGKRVDAPGVSIPLSGLVLGADSDFLAAGASQYGLLHVAPQHAVVRVCEGQWVLEPGNRDMVLALNGEKITWGDSKTLHPGDTIDMGFVSLLVDMQAEPAEFAVEQIGEPVQAALPAPDTSHSVQAPPSFEPLELAVFQGSQDSQSPVPSEISEKITAKAPAENAAQELCALLAQDAQTSAGSDSMQYTSCSLESLLHSAPQQGGVTVPDMDVPARAPHLFADDPLAALAAESAHVLAGKTHLPDSCFPSTPSLTAISPLPTPGTLEPSPAAYADTPALDPLSGMSTATSLEEILAGPLTIDDVLEGLKRARPATHTVTDTAADPLAVLTAPERMPDPLLLLAGMDAAPVREPELPPVLHREHRTTGINSPYHFVFRTKHEETKEDSWLHPHR